MRKNVVLAVVGCILVSLVVIFEWRVAKSLPLTEQMTSMQNSRPGRQTTFPGLLLQGEEQAVQSTSADEDSEGPAPDPGSILLFGTGIVAWLMVMKISKGM